MADFSSIVIYHARIRNMDFDNRQAGYISNMNVTVLCYFFTFIKTVSNSNISTAEHVSLDLTNHKHEH